MSESLFNIINFRIQQRCFPENIAAASCLQCVDVDLTEIISFEEAGIFYKAFLCKEYKQPPEVFYEKRCS